MPGPLRYRDSDNDCLEHDHAARAVEGLGLRVRYCGKNPKGPSTPGYRTLGPF